MLFLPGSSYLKKVFRKLTGDKSLTRAAEKTIDYEISKKMARKIHTDKDRNDSHRKMLGKRKRERSTEEFNENTKQLPAEQDKECTVCLELAAETSFPDNKHASGREHSSDVCFNCWNQHIESEIISKDFDGISCLQCSHRLVEEEVRRFANESTYQTTRRSMLIHTPDISTEAPRATCIRMKSFRLARVPNALGVSISFSSCGRDL